LGHQMRSLYWAFASRKYVCRIASNIDDDILAVGLLLLAEQKVRLVHAVDDAVGTVPPARRARSWCRLP
jgi:hypothetical protein